MKFRLYIFRVIVVLAVVCAGIFVVNLQFCKSDDKHGGNEEGVIEFDSKAVDQSHPLAGLAPGSATLRYKKDKFIIEMSTMGMFNMSVIGNLQDKTLIQTVKFMDIKQYCLENEAEIRQDNDLYKIKIEETKETKKILGVKCHKLKITMVDQPGAAPFDAWYTKDLGMENCNALTPYAGVKGVLLDYRIKKMGMEMRFLAKRIENLEVPDATFEVPTYMKKVSKAEMQKFFNDLQ
jgi:GLPGLI family protein